jgi:hypothetical protein
MDEKMLVCISIWNQADIQKVAGNQYCYSDHRVEQE